MVRSNKLRVGDWLPSDPEILRKWVTKLKAKGLADPADYIGPIKDLQNLVASTPSLASATQTMFVEGYDYDPDNPLGAPSVQSWPEFLGLLNSIMTIAPEFYVDEHEQALGLVGFPINALFDWPMGTSAGYEVFSNELFNAKFRNVLNHWGYFLTTEPSRYVLAQSDPSSDPPTIGWLSPPAIKQMIDVACQPSGGAADCTSKRFQDIFQVPDPNDPAYMGFTSWDEFFTREFQPDMRPVGDAPIVSACESAPLQYKTNVSYADQFWLKGQPYSLIDMLGFPSLAAQFEGGTVYQAFLSALSYHRWNSPVDGKIELAWVINGSYYLENMSEGIASGQPDPSAPNASQPFITSVATRAVILIRADDPKIGLMAFVAVGMAEVSSCAITVSEGETVKKGDPLGMFHFGGSTHCLIFDRNVSLDFVVPVSEDPNLGATNIAVKGNLAYVK